jgi:hypothetical protein
LDKSFAYVKAAQGLFVSHLLSSEMQISMSYANWLNNEHTSSSSENSFQSAKMYILHQR